MINRFCTWWGAKFLGAELALSFLVAISLVLWAEKYGGQSILSTILENRRADIYTVAISLAGSMLGFIIATVAIVLSFSSHDRMDVVRNSKYYHTLWRTFISAMYFLAVTLIVMIVGLLFDRDGNPNYMVFYTGFFFILLSSFRIGRCIWIMKNIISIVAPMKKSTS